MTFVMTACLVAMLAAVRAICKSPVKVGDRGFLRVGFLDTKHHFDVVLLEKHSRGKTHASRENNVDAFSC